MFQSQKAPPVVLCVDCWSTRDNDQHPVIFPTEHPRRVFTREADRLYCHRLVGFGNDGIETVCGQRWTNGGLTATFTGA